MKKTSNPSRASLPVSTSTSSSTSFRKPSRSSHPSPRHSHSGPSKATPSSTTSSSASSSSSMTHPHKPPSRPMCGCKATRHSLVTNCLTCGYIVCEEEGPRGPCPFCQASMSNDSYSTPHALQLKHRLMAMDHGAAMVIHDEFSDDVPLRWLVHREKMGEVEE
ncbi:Activating signal cointegrator 1 [Coelomomyces lativittatus]|nr:Activating signal cointegrator 1 [Coelomomyces lativittatus]KAJ1516033.1 Activating signal cointegrator 1 [Coelomomyces lativittatus]KAJ1518610.1 Activating signal cointegrator 1 [Coelomomyces lativittatus]